MVLPFLCSYTQRLGVERCFPSAPFGRVAQWGLFEHDRPQKFAPVWLEPAQHQQRVWGCGALPRGAAPHSNAHALARQHEARQRQPEHPGTCKRKAHRVRRPAAAVFYFDDTALRTRAHPPRWGQRLPVGYGSGLCARRGIPRRPSAIARSLPRTEGRWPDLGIQSEGIHAGRVARTSDIQASSCARYAQRSRARAPAATSVAVHGSDPAPSAASTRDGRGGRPQSPAHGTAVPPGSGARAGAERRASTGSIRSQHACAPRRSRRTRRRSRC